MNKYSLSRYIKDIYLRNNIPGVILDFPYILPDEYIVICIYYHHKLIIDTKNGYLKWH